MLLNEVIYVAVAPLLVAAIAAFGLRWVQAPPTVTWATGVALGYIAGQFVLASRAGVGHAFDSLINPHEASHWLPLAVLLALGVTLLATYAPRSWRDGIIALGTLLSVAVPARLLAGHTAQQWSMLEKLSHLAILSATLGLVWLLLASAGDDRQPRLRQALLVLVATGAAIVATQSGSFTYGRHCGVVAAALTGVAVVSPRGVSGAAGVVTFTLGSLVILSCFYAELPPMNAALLFVSLIGAAGRLPEVVSMWPAWRQAALRTALSLVPLALAIGNSMA